MKRLLYAFVILFFSLCSFSQKNIYLTNPSFEDLPRAGNPPTGWFNCGFPEESPPDTQPGAFSVKFLPCDGYSYLGMVVRENETWESVSQQLSDTLKRENCYKFSIYIARSLTYLSPTEDDDIEVNHVFPIKLRIWGGNTLCDKKELLAETKVITHDNWEEYHFTFQPKNDLNYIIFEAFYKTPILFPYNGNILLDNASEIIWMDCEVEELPKD